MKKMLVVSAAFAAVAALAFAAGKAAQAKSYQATGSIVELTDTKITVNKGKEGNWEIARDADTKMMGDLKVGDKATVHYRMIALSIEPKAAEKKEEKAEDRKN